MTVKNTVGFSPWLTSFMHNDIALEQHADELEFDWVRRDRSAQAPHYRLKDLVRVDAETEAQIDALICARDAGWQAVENLGFSQDGMVFSGAILALQAKSEDYLQIVIDAACGNPILERGLIAAFGWLPFDQVASQLRRFLGAQSTILQRIAIAGFAVHRQDPGIALQAAATSQDLTLQARALKACGELGRRDLAAELSAGVRNPDEPVRFYAAWSLARLGLPSAVVLDCLRDVAIANGPYAVRAACMLVRNLKLQPAKDWCRQLRQSEHHQRLGIIGLGVIGDPEAIPELLAATQVLELARVAGGAFADITGIDLDYEDLDEEDPRRIDLKDASSNAPTEEEIELPFEDEHLCWPNTAAAFVWWNEHRGQYAPGKRHLRGKPIEQQWLNVVLREGTQQQRGMAAIELGILSPTAALFPVLARARKQQSLLGLCIS